MSEATATKRHKTEAGNYFVSNYPPFSFWSPDGVSEATDALNRPPAPGNPLGLYLHIPFCRKRCHFCYFRVYTGKKSQEKIEAAFRASWGLHRDKNYSAKWSPDCVGPSGKPA